MRQHLTVFLMLISSPVIAQNEARCRDGSSIQAYRSNWAEADKRLFECYKREALSLSSANVTASDIIQAVYFECRDWERRLVSINFDCYGNFSAAENGVEHIRKETLPELYAIIVKAKTLQNKG